MFAGVGPLLRLALRRDRLLVLASIMALVVLVVGSAKATLDLYADAATARAGLGGVLDSPAVLALYGPASTASLAGMSIFKTNLMGAVLVGILGYAIVRRHTRVEEEDGRLELLESAQVDRRAPLIAALLIGAAAVLSVSVFCAAGLAALGFDLRGSIAFGAGWAGLGLVMCGVSAVAAQLTSSARGAAAWALGALGVGYLLRAIGDLQAGPSGNGSVLSWLSPVGWVGRTDAYGADRSWVFGLSLGLTTALIALAFVLLEHRDLGSGLLHARPGRPDAPGWLDSGQALVWRLVRTTALGWAIAGLVLGSVVGALTGSVEDMMSSPGIADMLRKLGGGAGTLQQLYIGSELRIIAAILTACGIAIVVRMAGEERSGRSEMLHALALGRRSWAGAFAGCGYGICALLVVGIAALIGAVGHSAAADAPDAWAMVKSGLVCVPAVWLVISLGALAVCISPKLGGTAWAVLALAFGLGEFGRTLNLPGWLVTISPFDHMDVLPIGELHWADWLVMTALTAAITTLALEVYARRDLLPD